MTNYTIRQKQELTDKLKGAKYFRKDTELFQQKFPNSPLNRELARANEVNMPILSGQILYNLLSVVSEEDIVANRESKTVVVPEAENVVVAAPSAQIVADSSKKKGKNKKNGRK